MEKRRKKEKERKFDFKIGIIYIEKFYSVFVRGREPLQRYRMKEGQTRHTHIHSGFTFYPNL